MMAAPFDSYTPIIFQDVDSYYDLHLLTTEEIVIPVPKRKVTQESIIGKNESVTFDEETYEDVQFSVKMAIVEADENAFLDKINVVKAWLSSGQGKLIITNEPDKYYIAQVVNKFDITPKAENWGEFTIEFNCNPVKRAVEDDKYIIFDQCTARTGAVINPLATYNFVGGIAIVNNIAVRIYTDKSTLITNNGNLKSKPTIDIIGSGNQDISIKDDTFSLLNLDNEIIVDSVSVNAYLGQTPKNGYMSGDFPDLYVGVSKVSWEGTGTIKQISIQCNSNWI